MIEVIASLVLVALFIYAVGFAIMMWRPFYVALLQGKMVTEVYGFTGIFAEWGKALIWPYLLIKKTG